MIPILTGSLLGSGCADPAAPNGCQTAGGNPAGSIATGGCPAPRVTEGCKTTVAVRVSGGITPRIDWSPACGMNHVMVRTTRADGFAGAVFWSLSAPGSLLGPGVIYGEEPPGASLEGPTRALQPGTSYTVFLEMIEDGTVITGQGTTSFTP
jgi:hypothetical protein